MTIAASVAAVVAMMKTATTIFRFRLVVTMGLRSTKLTWCLSSTLTIAVPGGGGSVVVLRYWWCAGGVVVVW